MTNSDVIPARARLEAEIFADIRALCTSSGYIHAVAYICWRDNMIRYSGSKVVEADLVHQYSHDRLLRTEISTLIGLMVQKPVDLSLPAPRVMQEYLDHTAVLLAELHHALVEPWREGWNLKAEEIPKRDLFSSAEAMREPIFYGGESAYNFQYRDLARLKYRADDVWLEENKGIRIDEVCQISEALGKFQVTRQRDWARLLRKQPLDQLTMLPGYTFTAHELVEVCGLGIEKVQRFLDAFSYSSHERNESFVALNEFNATNAAPILKVEQGGYILLQHYSLLEAIYESPFFWMAADKAYAPRALDGRGRFTEEFVTDRLRSVFGAGRVLNNVDIYKGKNRFAEVDTLVLYGDCAIVVQAKSKRLTIEARKGNDLQLKDDFRKAIQSAYDQALLCAEALTSDGFRFVGPSGVDISMEGKPRVVFPICIVSDHYPALAFQVRQFLKPKVTAAIQPPLVTDVFALDAFSEMLASPLHLLNYLALRARFGDKILVSQELAILGFHLKYNLWLDAQYTMVNLGDDFAGALDIAMQARRAGVPGERTPEGILTRFDGLAIGPLLAEIEKIGFPQLTGLGLFILQLSSRTAKLLSKGIRRIVRDAKSDGNGHDISIAGDVGDGGLTIHCNDLPEDVARERLSMHCKVRKYDGGANAWFGLLLEPATGRIRGALVIEEDWKPDLDMDAVMAAWRKRAAVPPPQLPWKARKIGRNQLCPCGSGKKHKKCCLSA